MRLASLPVAACFGSNVFNDFSNVVDDDVQIYINGSLVFDDTDGLATFMPVTSVLSYLHEGDDDHKPVPQSVKASSPTLRFPLAR